VWNWAGAPWHGEPVLRLVLSLTYSDGSKDKIVSSGSWKVCCVSISVYLTVSISAGSVLLLFLYLWDPYFSQNRDHVPNF
jgi:hypothetical protein